MKLFAKIFVVLVLFSIVIAGRAEATTWLIHPGAAIVPTYAVAPVYYNYNIGYVAPAPVYVNYVTPSPVVYATPVQVRVVVNDYWAVTPTLPSYYYPQVAPYTVVRPSSYPIVYR
jgi:hypothetical protein